MSVNQFYRILIIITLNHILLWPSILFSQIEEGTIVVRPKEIDDVLINPGIGFTTFQMFNGDNLTPNQDVLRDPNPDIYQMSDGNLENINYPMTSIAYFRILWSFIEPERGNYNWNFIDEILKIAHERDQTVMLRISPYKGRPRDDVPGWYREMVGPETEFAHEKWVVDPEDLRYSKYFGNMIRALGKRYDGHADLESVDVSIVGWAGEGGGTEMLTEETMQKLLDPYIEAFTKTPLTVLLHGKKANEYITSKATVGWRQDCLGDLGFWAEEQNGWTHMYDYYPQTIIKYEMKDAWEDAPVTFEVCGTFNRWKERESYTLEDVAYIFNQALKWHISSFNAKSSPVPEEWKPLVNDWLKKMGYRFILRRFSYPEAVRQNGKLAFESWWENKGVAPCYKDVLLAIRLINDKNEQILITDANIKEWLPGDNILNDAVFLPLNFPIGTYNLQIGIVDRLNYNPRVKLAIEDKGKDGWYNLGEIEVIQ